MPDPRGEDATRTALRERIAEAMCEAPPHGESWASTSYGDQEWMLSMADAVLDALGLEQVAKVKECALETGAEWVDAAGQTIEHVENPHRLLDGTALYVIRGDS